MADPRVRFNRPTNVAEVSVRLQISLLRTIDLGLTPIKCNTSLEETSEGSMTMANNTVWHGVVGGDDYEVDRYDEEFVVYRPSLRGSGVTVYEIVGYSNLDPDRTYTDTDYVNIVAEAIAQEAGA